MIIVNKIKVQQTEWRETNIWPQESIYKKTVASRFDIGSKVKFKSNNLTKMIISIKSLCHEISCILK